MKNSHNWIDIPDDISGHDAVQSMRVLLTKRREGKSYGTRLDKESTFTRTFGCHNCPHLGRWSCPHGATKQKMHARGICSKRVDEVLDLAEYSEQFSEHSKPSLSRTMSLMNYEKLKMHAQDIEEQLAKRSEKLRAEDKDYLDDPKVLELYDRITKGYERLIEHDFRMIKHEEGTKVKHEGDLRRLQTIDVDNDDRLLENYGPASEKRLNGPTDEGVSSEVEQPETSEERR